MLWIALAGQCSLHVVHDVWQVLWLSPFSKPAHGNESSSLLCSTRQRAVARNRRIGWCVEIGTLHGPAAVGVLLDHAKDDSFVCAYTTDARVKRAVFLGGGLLLAHSVLGHLVLLHGWVYALVQLGRQRTGLLRDCQNGTPIVT